MIPIVHLISAFLSKISHFLQKLLENEKSEKSHNMGNIYKKRDGSSVVKGNDGKIVRNLPAASKMPSSSPTLPAKASAEDASATPSLYEIRRAEFAKREEDRVKTREIMAEFTDSIEQDFPKAKMVGLNDNYEPVSLESWDGEVVETLTAEKYPELFKVFSENKEHIEGAMNAAGWSQKERTAVAPGATQLLFMLFRCKEGENCQFRHTGYGFAPQHEAGRYCRSGRRNHCTCDSCF